ncbi:hypothetical protein [Paenibacillus cucumis (ex Kampfer et al. 2016)]|uniref:Uncharacterized protein n=1 Tax=Paenibacillus cucumis (ex Kampfer et al. 2016) TaxID=1776858 RepID=A0ABS7KJV2_9BACL|nr:hypothetical protein [Paenibacillus cucumis (ex Kampfer et al. 2016)]MBY0204433.1 hypothetical protein [Paenibacillus cucumis (ex Kampfer et al. 2016)]
MIRVNADDVSNIVDKYSRLDIENASPMDGLCVALLDVYRCSLSQSEAREKITFECHNLAHEDKFFDFFSDIFINDAESCFIFIQKSNSESSRKMMKAKGFDDAEIKYLLEIKKFENELYAVTDITELKFWVKMTSREMLLCNFFFSRIAIVGNYDLTLPLFVDELFFDQYRNTAMRNELYFR